MYADVSTARITTVFWLPRGTGRFYYVGLDFDNDPRDGTWSSLLAAIAAQVGGEKTAS
jgi:hypothetical protein